MPARFHHAQVPVSRATLHCVSAGPEDGAPLLLLHGWPQTWFMWRDVMPLLADAGYRVIAPDLTGLGDSSRPTDGYDKASIARDMAELMVALGYDSYAVVAHDWGGPVAFFLAAQFPDRVTAMAIFDAPVLGDGGPVEHHSRWHFGFHAIPEWPEQLVSDREDLYLRFFYRFAGARSDAIAEEAQAEYVRSYSQPGAMTAGFNYYRAVPQDLADVTAFREGGGKLAMPILVYGGDPATRGRGRSAMESWQRVATDVRGGVAENCGHWIPEERPEWAAEQIVAFMKAVS